MRGVRRRGARIAFSYHREPLCRRPVGGNRRLGQIDQAVEEAAKRGKTNTALSAMEVQRRARAGLTSERNEAAATQKAALKAERASLAAQNRRLDTEAAPIRYVAEAARRSGAAQGLSIALRPASVILTVLRSAVASPARTRPASVLRLKPWANMIVSLAPNGMLASS